MIVTVYKSLDHLPPSYASVFGEAGRMSFYYGLPWFENLIRNTSIPNQELRLYGLETNHDEKGCALALLIARIGSKTRLNKTYDLSGFSNLYSPLFGPLWRPSIADPTTVAYGLVDAIVEESPRWATIRFDCLDRKTPMFDALADAFRGKGMMIQPFFHFGNWFEDIAGSFDEFFRKRPAGLRNTLRRKSKKLEALGSHRYKVFADQNDLDVAIDAYEHVYAASWKQPEPFPKFTGGLIKTAASAGCLRLGVLYIEERPVAAQIWIVSHGTATILKLAHDERFKALSPGSLLTFQLMRRVIEVDGVHEVDFGRGDEPFKSLWLSQRRERWGILAFNARTLRGAVSAARHLGGSALRRRLGNLVKASDCGSASGRKASAG